MGSRFETIPAWRTEPSFRSRLGYWLALSGAPCYETNVALLDTEDPVTYTNTVGPVDNTGMPTEFWPAGAGCNIEPISDWEHVGERPSMISTWNGKFQRPDERV